MFVGGRLLVFFFFSIHKSFAENDYGLQVEPPTVQAYTGDKPEFSCYVNQSASYLLTNKITWEYTSYNGQKTEISNRANINGDLKGEYSLQFEGTNTGKIFKLQFLTGVDKQHNGVFKCVLYDKNNVQLASGEVKMTVVNPGLMNTTIAARTGTDMTYFTSSSASKYFWNYYIMLAAVLMKK